MKYVIRIKTTDDRMGYYERYDGKTIHLTDVPKWSIKFRTEESAEDAARWLNGFDEVSSTTVEEHNETFN